MNCTEPVPVRLIDATEWTVVASNQAAAVAAGLSRDRTAHHASARKLPNPIGERPISPRTLDQERPAEIASKSATADSTAPTNDRRTVMPDGGRPAIKVSMG
jgi:hypothetical protein